MARTERTGYNSNYLNVAHVTDDDILTPLERTIFILINDGNAVCATTSLADAASTTNHRAHLALHALTEKGLLFRYQHGPTANERYAVTEDGEKWYKDRFGPKYEQDGLWDN